MSKAYWLTGLLVLFGLSGLAVLRVQAIEDNPKAEKPKASKDRFFEMRTYIAAPGKLDALNARFRNHTNKLFVKHGMELIGYWTPAEGSASENTLIYILAYPDKDAREKSWKAFQADPEWQRVRTETEANGKLVEKVEQVFLKPTDYSPIK
ncbi:MAG: NIPSNAP family protein [Planctomycetes bacterium]|nr:NIPSNAP family protein [Planctomycetota bacterium]